MAVYGYVRHSLVDQKKGLEAQKETAMRFFQKVLAPQGLTFAGFYQDTSSDSGKLLTSRLMGFRLNAKLKRGDAVVIARGDRCFPSLRDLIDVAQAWHAMGVRVVVIDAGLDTATEDGKLTLAHYDYFLRWQSKMNKATRNEFDAAALRGDLKSFRVKGGSPIGWKTVGGALVPYEEERENFRKIQEIHREKGTYLQTVKEAARRGIVSCRGKRPYTRGQVRRMLARGHEILADEPPQPTLHQHIRSLPEEERLKFLEEVGYQRPDHYRDRHLKRGGTHEKTEVDRELPDERDGGRDPGSDSLEAEGHDHPDR